MATYNKWIYIYAQVPARQTKWTIVATIWLPLEFCIFAKRLLYEKPYVINQAIAALKQSVGLLFDRFVTVWKNCTGHTHTHTHKHNPAAHVHWGLKIQYETLWIVQPQIQTHTHSTELPEHIIYKSNCHHLNNDLIPPEASAFIPARER